MTAYAESLEINVRDVTGQRPYVARGLPVDLSVGDMVRRLSEKMNLPRTDSAGLPHSYHAYLDREARHLHAGEKVGDALQDQDSLVLRPDIQAG